MPKEKKHNIHQRPAVFGLRLPLIIKRVVKMKLPKSDGARSEKKLNAGIMRHYDFILLCTVVCVFERWQSQDANLKSKKKNNRKEISFREEIVGAGVF